MNGPKRCNQSVGGSPPPHSNHGFAHYAQLPSFLSKNVAGEIQWYITEFWTIFSLHQDQLLTQCTWDVLGWPSKSIGCGFSFHYFFSYKELWNLWIKDELWIPTKKLYQIANMIWDDTSSVRRQRRLGRAGRTADGCDGGGLQLYGLKRRPLRPFFARTRNLSCLSLASTASKSCFVPSKSQKDWQKETEWTTSSDRYFSCLKFTDCCSDKNSIGPILECGF